MKVRVYHASYGCDTGCCGHILQVGNKQIGEFDFFHSYEGLPKEEVIELAKKEIEKHHPECLASIDWDSIEIDIGKC